MRPAGFAEAVEDLSCRVQAVDLMLKRIQTATVATSGAWGGSAGRSGIHRICARGQSRHLLGESGLRLERRSFDTLCRSLDVKFAVLLTDYAFGGRRTGHPRGEEAE